MTIKRKIFVKSDPKKRSIYDEEIGIGRPQPFQGVPQNPQNVHQWSPGMDEHEYIHQSLFYFLNI